MTREKAIQVEHLLYKIERYEALLDEIASMEVLEEIKGAYIDGSELEKELIAVVQAGLDNLLKKLEDM